MAAQAKAVAVGILNVHFTNAPGHIRWRLTNDRPALLVLLMKRVDVLDENGHPHARLPLPSFAQKNLDLAPRDATEGGRVTPVPFLAEAQLVDVVVHRGGEILDV